MIYVLVFFWSRKLMCYYLQGDHVSLLSSLEEMGLRLRLDVPEQVMRIANVIFRTSTPSNEAAAVRGTYSFQYN